MGEQTGEKLNLDMAVSMDLTKGAETATLKLNYVAASGSEVHVDATATGKVVAIAFGPKNGDQPGASHEQTGLDGEAFMEGLVNGIGAVAATLSARSQARADAARKTTAKAMAEQAPVQVVGAAAAVGASGAAAVPSDAGAGQAEQTPPAAPEPAQPAPIGPVKVPAPASPDSAFTQPVASIPDPPQGV